MGNLQFAKENPYLAWIVWLSKEKVEIAIKGKDR
jgi:hypothetical protein